MNKLEKELLSGLKIGDIKSFDVIFKSYYSNLCHYSSDFVKSFNASEEIVQVVFIKFWENRETIDIQKSLKAYLYRMVYYASLDHIRKNKAIKHSEIQIDEHTNQIDMLMFDEPGFSFDAVYSEQMEEDLTKAIESLPSQCRQVFGLSRFEKLPYSQIANQLNISVSSVKAQMRRAVSRLLESMDQYLDK
jgi:RNA polymerase sigma-70 factor (family 1)